MKEKHPLSQSIRLPDLSFAYRTIDIVLEEDKVLGLECGDLDRGIRHPTEEQKIILERRQQSFNAAQRILKNLTDETIYTLKQFIGYGYEWENPNVVTVGAVEYKEFFRNCLSDDDGMPLPPRTSFFTQWGIKDYNHPDRPTISYFLPHFGGNGTIVEESTHFLQWRSEKTIADDIRTPNYLYGHLHRENEQGQIVVNEIPGSKLVRAYFRGFGKEEEYAKSMVWEGTAQIVRTLCGLDSEISLPADRGQNRTYQTLAKMFIGWGRERCYEEILKMFNIGSMEELWKVAPFSVIQGHFPSDLFHYLGYTLGEEIAKAIRTEDDKNAFVQIAFSQTSDYRKKLDDMIDFRKQLLRSA